MQYDAGEEVFYEAIQEKYTTGFYSRQACQLHPIYGPFVASFCQNFKPHLAWILAIENFLFFQAIYYL